MAGIFKRPVGPGLGVCHDPTAWWARIPGKSEGAYIYVRDRTYKQEAYLSIEPNGDPSESISALVSKALLCDFAWAILKKFEVPHIQEELIKLERKANW